MPALFGHHIAKIISNSLRLLKQRRTARLAENCYSRYQSVTDILQQLDWPTLNERRNQMKLIMMYKIIRTWTCVYPA